MQIEQLKNQREQSKGWLRIEIRLLYNLNTRVSWPSIPLWKPQPSCEKLHYLATGENNNKGRNSSLISDLLIANFHMEIH